MSPAGKAGKKKSKEGSVLMDDAQRRRERITLLLFFLGGITIVIGMFLLSSFLSVGVRDVNRPLLYTFAVGAVLVTAGILYQVFTRKKTAA
jgi:hypothetical protein